MKKLFFIPVLFFLFSGQLPAQNQALKVLSYNIWNGFDWGKDSEREKEMVKWLKEQNADVIGFQELNGFTPEKLEQLASQWGHPYTLLLKEEGYPIGITSKTPLEIKSRMLGGFWHGMLHAKTRDIDFVVVHLSPQDWQFRRSEAEIISTYIENVFMKNQQDKFIVMGDFNAHSPFDAGFDITNSETRKENQKADSLRFAEKGNAAFQTLRNGAFDYSVMSRFLSLPLIDVVQLHIEEDQKTSFPTPLVTGGMSSEQLEKYQQRIDYILVSPYFETLCSHAEIINTGSPDGLSDHYPVVATFQYEE
ncbi:endonuclease/exonuclease/phosphatase family protein [Lunatibacter salilacus]|uniref:endonuclease/exonuclease/phosphatase family protein n=1 Tax=Lunatibacter salilacus TaxID=2483804 RepID=UPI00131C20E6|nr:endonuclease/exonuclease/phosphatase family protein [Lunatibacter salilacus]